MEIIETQELVSKKPEFLKIGNVMRPTISSLLYNDARRKVKDLYIKLLDGGCGCGCDKVVLPPEPLLVMNKIDLQSTRASRQILFLSYFTSEKEKEGIEFKLDFFPSNVFEYCLFGLYAKMKGRDEAVLSVLEQEPSLYIFTIKEAFDALFRPYLKPEIAVEISSIKFVDNIAIIEDESYDCFELLGKLHNHKLLHKLTYYMSENRELFE
jgi:hypothetical protein